MPTDDLIVTGITMLPANYKGEAAVLSIDLYDKEGEIYESEIHLDEGVDFFKLSSAVAKSMQMMDSPCVKVHVKSFRIKKD